MKRFLPVILAVSVFTALAVAQQVVRGAGPTEQLTATAPIQLYDDGGVVNISYTGLLADGGAQDTCTGTGPCLIGQGGIGVDAGITVVGVNGVTIGGTFSSSIASGSNAFSVATNGARVDFGAGASDYASSDGTTVTFTGPLASTAGISTNGDVSLASGGALYLNGVTHTAYMFFDGTDIQGSSPGLFKFTGLSATSFRLGSNLAISGTPPTIASGFGTSPSIGNSNGTFAWSIIVGTGGTDQNGTLTMPAAAHAWYCQCNDVQTPSSFITSQTGGNSTSCTFTNYSRTTGLATAWTAGDELRCTGAPY